MDSMGAPITYSFVNGSPSSYRQHFEIDSQSGVVKQIKPVDVSETKRFDIVVKVILHNFSSCINKQVQLHLIICITARLVRYLGI